jgi:VWFA-related protein
MIRFAFLLGSAALVAFADETVVFRSDVALIRVDAQVVDRDNRTIAGLRVEDFVLRDEGKTQEIRNFAREEMPVDFLFLLDVSASMRPHVQRIADAAHDAVRVLSDEDRFAIMVFDRSTRLRMPFRKGRAHLENEFDAVLRHEDFRGGTDITRGMYDAVAYMGREGRREARRAIVILTDDETQLQRDDQGVVRALQRADTVMSALIAPDAVNARRGNRGYGGPNGGGPLGGIILGRGGLGGRGPRGGGPVYAQSRSAGTSEIALHSGGDSIPVDEASALETTLSRIRQRYALHYIAPAGVRPGDERAIDVTLAAAARNRYPDAVVRFRRVYMAPDRAAPAPPGTPVTTVPADEPVVVLSGGLSSAEPAATVPVRRRRAVNEDGSPALPAGSSPDSGTPSPGILKPDPGAQPASRGWRRVDEPSSPPAAPVTSKPDPPAKDPKDSSPHPGGWRRVTQPDPQRFRP